MPEKLNMSALYAASLPPRRKQDLLAVYRDYISLVRNLEQVVRRYKPLNLANYQITRLYEGEVVDNPWEVEEITPEARRAYTDFIANKPAEHGAHYCFVSVNYTSAQLRSEEPGIFSTPENFAVHSAGNSLPARIERYVAAYEKGETLEDARFVISGRWLMKYNHDAKGRSLADAFADEWIEKRFQSMLDVLALLPPEKSRYSEKDVETAQTEALSSALIAPFENVLLSSLAALSEESNGIMRELFGRRAGQNYMAQAESEGLLPSAAAFQDCLNIRHLMHHQWDTLDGIGKFNERETVKNVSVRRRYLDSYCRLCDRPLLERLDAYVGTAKSFAPLVSALNPDLLIRGENESNSKFVSRIKEYARANPEAALLVETNYPYGSDKKEALIKNVAKLFPAAAVIDRSGMDIDGFLERVAGYLYRKNYLEVFQQIEYKMSQFCLFNGKNVQPSATWAYFRSKKMLSAEEAERWAEFKQLRNDLSHKYLDAALSARLEKLCAGFMQAAIILEDRIDAASPVISLQQGNVYRAVHKDGRIVDIDYAERRILSVSRVTDTSAANRSPAPASDNAAHLRPSAAASSRPSETRVPDNSWPSDIRNTTETKTHSERRMPNRSRPSASKTPSSSRRPYIEEYPNGISIAVAGTDVVSCRLANGVLLHLQKGRVDAPDGSKLYLNGSERCFLTLKGGVKLITDRRFQVLNYIVNGRSVSIAKNETMKFPNGHGISLDNRGFLNCEEFSGTGGAVVRLFYKTDARQPAVRFSDGTGISLSSGGIRVFHAGRELTYSTRKAFAESYGGLPPALNRKKGSDGR